VHQLLLPTELLHHDTDGTQEGTGVQTGLESALFMLFSAKYTFPGTQQTYKYWQDFSIIFYGRFIAKFHRQTITIQ